MIKCYLGLEYVSRGMVKAKKGLIGEMRRCMRELARRNKCLPSAERLHGLEFLLLSDAIAMSRHFTKWENKAEFYAKWEAGVQLDKLAIIKERLPLTQAQERTLQQFEKWAAHFKQVCLK